MQKLGDSDNRWCPLQRLYVLDFVDDVPNGEQACIVKIRQSYMPPRFRQCAKSIKGLCRRPWRTSRVAESLPSTAQFFIDPLEASQRRLVKCVFRIAPTLHMIGNVPCAVAVDLSVLSVCLAYCNFVNVHGGDCTEAFVLGPAKNHGRNSGLVHATNEDSRTPRRLPRRLGTDPDVGAAATWR